MLCHDNLVRKTVDHDFIMTFWSNKGRTLRCVHLRTRLHCIAENIKISTEIATVFTKKSLTQLLWVFHLLTKELSRSTPTCQEMWVTLQELRVPLITKKLRKLAIPRMRCRLNWMNHLEYFGRDLPVSHQKIRWSTSLVASGLLLLLDDQLQKRVCL